MAVKSSSNSSNDISYFIDSLHDIRKEQFEARKKRLAKVEQKKSSKQLGFSFKSGQEKHVSSRGRTF